MAVAASDLAVLAGAVERLLNTGAGDHSGTLRDALKRAYLAVSQ